MLSRDVKVVENIFPCGNGEPIDKQENKNLFSGPKEVNGTPQMVDLNKVPEVVNIRPPPNTRPTATKAQVEMHNEPQSKLVNNSKPQGEGPVVPIEPNNEIVLKTEVHLNHHETKPSETETIHETEPNDVTAHESPEPIRRPRNKDGLSDLMTSSLIHYRRLIKLPH